MRFVSSRQETYVYGQYRRAGCAIWQHAAGAIWRRERRTCGGIAVHRPGVELRGRSGSSALDPIEKKPFSIGRLQPTPVLVDEYFNASTGDGSEGDTDIRVPWSSSFGLKPVESEINGGGKVKKSLPELAHK